MAYKGTISKKSVSGDLGEIFQILRDGGIICDGMAFIPKQRFCLAQDHQD